MFAAYRKIFAYPGAVRFSMAGVLARFPISMVTIVAILLISDVYGEYTIAGIVSAIFSISQALCAPQLAKLVDKYGQARVMRPSLMITLLGLVGFGFAAGTAAHPVWLYLSTAIAGAFMGSMGAMVRSRWNFAISQPGHLHIAYSWESVLDEFVFVVGPVLATFLATQFSPLFGLGAAILLAGGGGFWFLSQRATEPPAAGKESSPSPGTVLTAPGMLSVVLVFIFLGTIFGASDVATIGYSESLGLERYAGLVLASFAFGSLLSGLFYGTRNLTMPLWKQFVIGIVVLALGTSMFMFITGLAMLAAAMFVVGFGIAPTIISGNNLVQQLVPKHRLTEGLAWTGTSIGLGFALGAAVSGRFVDLFGAHSGFYAVFGASTMAATVALISARSLRRRHEETVRKATDIV